jgi:hypothetical protein
MATILEFRNSTQRAGRGTTAACEVIIFPGVRYERWDEIPPAPAKAKRRSRAKSHDHLEIPD